eukprot:2335724-Pyramimonas_sp.AAC.1
MRQEYLERTVYRSVPDSVKMSPAIFMGCSIVAFTHGYEGDAMMLRFLASRSFVDLLLVLMGRLVPHV